MRILFLCSVLAVTSILFACNVKKEQSSVKEVSSVWPDSVYINRGNHLVAITFDTLRSSLTGAISLMGIDGAIEFCNEQAYPLTRTYSDTVDIRRTALLYRNTQNRPDSLELLVLNQMADMPTPATRIVRTRNGEIHFFKPIMLQAMCLNCHGVPGKDIQPSALEAIAQQYPHDKAVNFKEGDFRGAWHLIFQPR